nr:MAG TPA: hypothetical protein [Caudoviricetes sp.]
MYLIWIMSSFINGCKQSKILRRLKNNGKRQ